MKTRVFFYALAVVAAASAISCVKEDLGQDGQKSEVEIVGQVFEAVHENVKSTLNGLTPTWVAGDVIDVYGSDKEVECTFVEGNKFQTAEGVTVDGPFYAIYPAADGNAVNKETGIFTATVPSEQVVPADQNVAAGALVAVAASDNSLLAFRNAVGLVKFDIQREDILSVKIESTAEGEPVAGKFNMNLNPDPETEGEEPTVTLVADAGVTNVVLKPAGEEGTTFAKGEYYATVLPTTLSGVKITFTRMNGEKTEKAEITKEAGIEILRNNGIDFGGFFTYTISTADDLLAWNKAAAKWTPWDVVTLTDDINCKDVITSANWTPQTFKGVFNGNNKTIDNFVIELAGPAAFFGELSSAVVKDLTFGENCSFTTTAASVSGSIYAGNRMYAASLACEAIGNTAISNIINNGSVEAKNESSSQGSYIAGICCSYESLIGAENCKNYGGVTFSGTPKSWTNLGGCFGQVTKEITLDGCENHGCVQFSGTNSSSVRLNMGGLVGGLENIIGFANCKNTGNVESNATAKHAGKTHIGGFVGYMAKNVLGTMENCSNGEEGKTSGALTNNAETTSMVTIGGCVGYVNGQKVSVSNFTNYGPITNKKPFSGNVALGGVVGQIDNATGNVITACANAGALTNNGAQTGNLYMGGCVGWLNGCNTNFSEVSNSANISTYVPNVTENNHTSVGGLLGCVQNTTSTVTDVENSGKLTSTSTGETFKGTLEIGGIIGFVNTGTITIGKVNEYSVLNSGEISGARAVDMGAGGIIGKNYGANTVIQYVKNTMPVQQSGWFNDPVLGNGIGGILGIAYSDEAAGTVDVSVSYAVNEGAVSKLGTGVGTVDCLHLGGIVGQFFSANMHGEITHCTNSADVTFLSDGNTYANAKSQTYTGGIIGYFECEGQISYCVNGGDVKSNINANNYMSVSVGGIAGCAANGGLDNCVNNGEVMDNSTSQGGYVGGIVGLLHTRPATLTNCDNNNAVSGKFDSESRKTSRSTVCIGGIVGASGAVWKKGDTNQSAVATYRLTMTGCDNDGSVTNNCPTNAANGKTLVGGLVGFCYENNITNCHNTGNVANLCTNELNELLGGLVGQVEGNNYTFIDNCSVNAEISTKKAGYSGFLIGRLTCSPSDTKTVTVTNIYVAGTFNGTTLGEDNFKVKCYGTASAGASNYKPTDSVTLGVYAAQ